MKTLGFLTMALLAASLTVSACGKKGDPVRPGVNKEEKKNS